MHAAVTVHMAAPPEAVWNVISDVRNTPRFSPEVFESEWLGGATGQLAGRDTTANNLGSLLDPAVTGVVVPE